MIEYRHDPAANRTVFMEVNGRFWGSLPLAYHSGAHFAWYNYAVLGRGVIPEPSSVTSSIRCRYMVPEVRHLWRNMMRSDEIQNNQLIFNRGKEILSFIIDFLRPRTRYYAWSWRDPIPRIIDLLFICKKTLKGG